MAPVPLPPIPQPPHDPTSWLLDARTGWRAAKLTNIQQLTGSGQLALELEPGNRRLLTEANGSFGGARPPANVAIGPDGSIYLLDAGSQQLKRFDACECRFQTVPCFGGEGSGPRQLRTPHGIGICSGNLFVCDTGNHRVSVFSLHGFVLRGYRQPPPSAYQGPNPKLANAWQPYDLAFDGRGRTYVSDAANGCIHRFGPSGTWEDRLAGFGQVTWLAVDCLDRVFAVIEDAGPSVRVVEPDGASIGQDTAPVFARPPFEVDRAGNLHLGPLCTPISDRGCGEPSSLKCPAGSAPERGVFDARGNVVEQCATADPPVFMTSGMYFGTALDSRLYRCQWHRLILRGDIPPGSRAIISTYAAEALLTDDMVQALGADQWETNQTADKTEDGEWDCLIRSGGGRFLWLRVELRGNGKVTPRLESLEIEFPRISLRRYLPAVFGEEPASADFTDRFLSLFDTTIRSVETEVDRQARYFDPLSTPAERDPKTGTDFLSWLASWIGITLDRHWPEAKRRKLLKQAARLFDLRGTREGLWRELMLFLEMDTACCDTSPPTNRCGVAPLNCAPAPAPECVWQPPPLILEHFKLRRWLFLGAGRLGDQAELWGKRIVNRSQLDDGAQVGRTQLISTPDPYRDPFHVYAHRFTVFVPVSWQTTDARRKALENLLKRARPASTLAEIEYVGPLFRIGFQSMIGLDSVVARYPSGVTLNESTLGRASVLSEPPRNKGGPSQQIGNQSRIGSTTTLE